jgi:lipopolysaccharide cholinephosphotransferase
MRSESISDRLFLNTGKYADIIKYQDQDVLNLTLKGKIKGISRIYNFTSRDSVKYLDQAHDARIIHFTGPEKPWNNYGGDGRIYTHYLYDKYIDFMSMTREEPSELQLAILGVYKEFKRICDENGLRYYANGGTKIGAVRHEGFIPWDDDIDIDMPMEDYYKFIKLTKQHLGPDYELRHMFGGITSTLVNKNTMYTEYYYLGYPEKYTGIFVDIHPVFGTPENKQERREFVDKMFELANDIIFNSIAGNYTDTETSLRPELKEYRELSTMYPVNQSSYLLTVLGRLRDRGLYEAKAFLNSFNLKFEDTTVPVSIGFDAQLKKQYGDYSLRGAPTTEAERSIHKSRAIIDIHKSYSAYAIELKDSELAKASRYLSRQVAMGWLEISKKDTENKGLRFNLEQARTRSPDVLGIKESIKSTARAVYRRITR